MYLEKFGSWAHVPDLSCSWIDASSLSETGTTFCFLIPMNSLIFCSSIFPGLKIYAPLVRMDIFILKVQRETLIKRMSLSRG